jgi:hypothetical protein
MGKLNSKFKSSKNFELILGLRCVCNQFDKWSNKLAKSQDSEMAKCDKV